MEDWLLQSIRVYWFSLVKVPTSTIHKLQKLVANFLWRGANKTIGFHLSKWKTIASPKELGGWGIRNIYWFAKSLAAKSCWRGIFGNSFWSQILKGKYIKGVDLSSWIRKGNFKYPNASNFWKKFMSSFHIIKQWLAWQIGSKKQIIIGKDPFIGDNSSYNLFVPLIHSLNNKGFYSIAQAVVPNTLNHSQIWLNANQLRLTGDLSNEWNNYIELLKRSGVSLTMSNDKLVWSWNKAFGSVSVDLAYQCIVINSHIGDYKWWYKSIWKFNIPSKVICFMWLCLKDCILTSANYKKRGGIVVCSLCLKDYETTKHLLIHCEATQNISKEILKSINFSNAWMQTTLERNLFHWFIKYPRMRFIPFMVSWIIWKYRNKILFENWKREDSMTISRILFDIKEFKGTREVDKVDFILNPVFFYQNLIGFFDGATVNDNYGVGIYIKLSAQHNYKAYFARGKGNNMKDQKDNKKFTLILQSKFQHGLLVP